MLPVIIWMSGVASPLGYAEGGFEKEMELGVQYTELFG